MLKYLPPQIIRVAILQASSANFCGVRPILSEMERKGLKKAPPHLTHRNSLQVLIERISTSTKKVPAPAAALTRRHSILGGANTHSIMNSGKVMLHTSLLCLLQSK
jgi:hypothetical protein